MSDLKALDLFEASDDLYVVEDQATMDAIDAGIRDSDAGRVVPLEEVRKMIPLWIEKYTSPKPR
jgi:predicted transcriptional regulator